jgi:virulence factor Mce-like protein
MLTALGVTTALAAAVIAVVAYRANSGLPWEHRYEVTVEVPRANRLINAADVRAGGVLVGEVLKVSAMPGRSGGRPYARVELALKRSVAPLPVDTTVAVRPASVLGLTYVDLHLGRSRRTIADGGTLPLASARSTVDLTDLLDVFDHGAARGFRQATRGLAYGVAGRGTDLNGTIGALDELLVPLTRTARTLAAPRTRLAQFLRGYEATLAALRPVDERLAHLVAGSATTLGALARERSALTAAVAGLPATERAVTDGFTRARPALDALAALADALRPAARRVEPTLRGVNRALVAGDAPLRAVAPFARRLRAALLTLEALSRDPASDGALRKLATLVRSTQAVVSFLLPAQLRCNELGLWSQTFSGGFLGPGNGQGPALATLIFTGLGASDELLQNPRPSPDVGLNPLPHENDRECEAGNEPWSGRQQLNNPPGEQSGVTRRTVPPPGVAQLAREAGLLDPIPGGLR